MQTLAAPETTEIQTQTAGEPPMLEQAPVEQAPAVPMEPTDQKAAPIIPSKGLSLWQPWASLIAKGARHIETRSWPTDYRGPIAILATKDLKPGGAEACERNPAIAKALADAGLADDTLPLGGIVAVADLVDCFQFTEGYDPGEPEKHFGDFTPGRWGFRLENIRALPTVLPCAGAQKIFGLSEDVIAELRKVLAAPAADSMPGALQDVPTLEWIYDEENESWGALSFIERDGERGLYVVSQSDDGSPIDPLPVQKWSVDETDADLMAGEWPDYFNSLDAAKAWCAAREAELFNASRKSVEAEPAPAEVEKVGDGEPISETPDADAWKAILSARHREREASERVEALTLDLKYAKKAHDAASDYLGQLIDEAQAPNLFTAAKKKDRAAPPTDGKPADHPVPVEDESWRSVRLDSLQPPLKASILKALDEHSPSIQTIGDVSDWTGCKSTSHPDNNRLTDINRIGPEGEKDVADATYAYFLAHPRTASPPADKPQEQKADGPGPLVWEEEKNDVGLAVEWNADNTAGAYTAPGEKPWKYFISLNNDGTYAVGYFGDDLDNGVPSPASLPSLESAQQWCQQQNDVAWARQKAANKNDASGNNSGEIENKTAGDRAVATQIWNKTIGKHHGLTSDGDGNIISASSDPIPAASLNLTEDAIRKAYYPKLLEASRGDKLPIITDTIEIDGALHIAVPASLMDSAAYVLIPLLCGRDNAVVSDTDRYGGIAVKRGDGTLFLGPATRSIRVSVNAPLSPPEAQAATPPSKPALRPSTRTRPSGEAGARRRRQELQQRQCEWRA